MKIAGFKKTILSHYRQAGRKFPWHFADPWGVMVSEFMLQQTRTERVIPYWENWMKIWPRPKALADASMEEALRAWSGLGYNRRCRYLKDSAAIIADENGGRVPETLQSLLLLPGVGPYMSSAIACFAYNFPAVFIETNIRSAVIHCFFSGRNDVRDSEIIPILEAALDRGDPRTWNYALMDYGAYLKKTTANPGRRSAHYTRQSPFSGSFRQARGKVIKALVSMGQCSAEELKLASGLEDEKLYDVLEKLKKESFVAEDGNSYRIKE
ncbi:MAG: A/G-specific adenine glycosylase [Treponema sp.]|jgi:A/G-specific adenine glycosylase|nr:A/G-specific adenine glycosylase [Treponema sp.]